MKNKIVRSYKDFLIKESIDLTGFKILPEGSSIPTSGVVKLGIDPTSDKLHLGHLVPIRMVKKLKDSGMDAHFILGTFTAMLGDPSGRSDMRPMLSAQQTKANAASIESQLKRIVGDDINIHYNNEWFDKMTLPEALKILSKFNVDYLMSRDSFQKRKDSGNPVGLHEIIVPILQGLDSVELNAKVEVGGTDQLFNFMISRDLQSKSGQEPEICLMAPVINGMDGRKMSKTFNNAIYINDSDVDIYGKVMSISDDVMYQWLPIFMDNYDKEMHPMKLKKQLAYSITEEIWGSDGAERGKLAFEKVIQSKEVPTDMRELPNAEDITNFVVSIMKCSRSEARRLITQGGVSVNGNKVSQGEDKLKPGDIVKVGKRNYAKVI